MTSLRTKVVDAVIGTLARTNSEQQCLAAQSLHEALRYPMDVTMEARQKWTADFVQTLTGSRFLFAARILIPLVSIEVAHAISSHAHHGIDETRAAARRIIGSLPNSLDFRTLLALCGRLRAYHRTVH